MSNRGGKKYGGKGRGRGQKGGRGGGGGGWGSRSGVRSDYAEIKKHHELFERYYDELGVVEEQERDVFWTALRRELPSSFRFAGSRGHALAVKERLVDHYIPQITAVEFDGQLVDPPRPIPWYPDGLAWSMTTPKNVVRKFPPFASFQKFLVSETSVGNISRQEVVSMIPPLLMDVKPGMTVLDLCAAPGSKSAQLIEMLHDGEEARIRDVGAEVAQGKGRRLSPDGMKADAEKKQAEKVGDCSDDGRATGLLIANDADYRRAQMLVHQVKRLNSPNLLVVNHDATMFPSIQLSTESGQRGRFLKFDRILADVPCSGDGTVRKNPNIWKEWSPSNGLGLYITQVRILVRALQMLKIGGRVVYSTCSMNPVENEAVISTAIDRCGGLTRVAVIDCRDPLPQLKRSPGLSEWKIIDRSGRIWNSWDEVESAKAKGAEEGVSKLVEGMFPPKKGTPADEIPFSRCIRIYPHQQDTGGFFITVLEKMSEIRAKPESVFKKANPTPSIIAAVNEIEAQPTNGHHELQHIKALDDLAPPHVDPDNDMDEGNAPAAARQNQGNATPERRSSLKRSLNEEADAAASTKRPKTREEVDEPAPTGDESRMVHWPPPPGAMLSMTEHAHESQQPKRSANQPREEPFIYLDPEHEELLPIYKFYELSPRFPRDRFMVRNATGQPVKAIYYTSALAREILTKNEGKGMKFVHCGVKMFMKQDAQGQDICRWRIQSEGLPIIDAWIGEERIVRLYKRETLRTLLKEMFPKVAHEGWKDLGDIGERVRDIGMGCCVLRVESSDAEDGFKEQISLPLWRSMSSLNLMLPKEERKAMLLRLFNDDTPLIDHSQDRFKKDTHTTTANGTADSTLATPPLISDALDLSAAIEGEDTATGGPAIADAPSPPDAEANDPDSVEPETFITDQGVAMNSALRDEESVPTTGIGETGIGSEEKATEAEDRVRGDAQDRRDKRREVAEGVDDEEDVFNTTV